MQSQFTLISLLLICLSGCAAMNADAPAIDWIEVPLSDNTFVDGTGTYQEGVYEIPVGAFSALEYKVGMNQGDVIVYEWNTDMQEPDLLTTEFHGHTERVGEEPGTVMFYKIHNDARGSGMLKAPFTGIHGWYLANDSEQDILVHLRVAGFYSELAQ